eukprot:scaffold69114_cov66-Cyclotella_meneghiniana.AAC.1
MDNRLKSAAEIAASYRGVQYTKENGSTQLTHVQLIFYARGMPPPVRPPSPPSLSPHSPSPPSPPPRFSIEYLFDLSSRDGWKSLGKEVGKIETLRLVYIEWGYPETDNDVQSSP